MIVVCLCVFYVMCLWGVVCDLLCMLYCVCVFCELFNVCVCLMCLCDLFVNLCVMSNAWFCSDVRDIGCIVVV